VQRRGGRVLTEAQAFYRQEGYREVAPFNAEPYAHHWFEKRLQRKDRLRNARRECPKGYEIGSHEDADPEEDLPDHRPVHPAGPLLRLLVPHRQSPKKEV
jgi:hypothetical protein